MQAMQDLKPLLAAAEWIVRSGGALALEYFHQRDALQIDRKGRQDLVSDADREVEQLLRRELQQRFPGDGFLGEEYGLDEADAIWVIDPIDGTTNFLRGVPEFALTLCRVVNGTPQLGLIYQPLRDELLCAIQGQGAWCNGQPHRISTEPVCAADAVLGLGYSQRGQRPQQALAMLGRWMDAGCVTRQTGAAAIGLSMVILGQTDGFYEPFLYSWDALAGQLIARETGLRSSPLLCGERLQSGGPVWVARPELFDLVTPPPDNR